MALRLFLRSSSITSGTQVVVYQSLFTVPQFSKATVATCPLLLKKEAIIRLDELRSCATLGTNERGRTAVVYTVRLRWFIRYDREVSDRRSFSVPSEPPAQAVEVAPDAHGGQRRPSCVRVCCRKRAPCAALRALRPGPACSLFETTLNFCGSAPRPPCKYIVHWYGRPRRLPDAEVSDAPRAYHAADGGAPTRTSWEQLF
ncbi:hypothetical protein EVAR_75258_1 [Eumeta japonica]|uniref:Uncharacterized protein n=1 Tax=Eumeta variegata TaxID=151549 RepID=A0A4C1VBS2_EUMVA|nr:hypothetical protein EVAR_75258_1 [Eumeta japonica]